MHGEKSIGRDGRLVLLVDDDVDIRKMLRAALDAWGYRVAEAANGREAVEVATRERPDVIAMDLKMPVLDGYTASCRIRARAELSRVPIILITAQCELGAECYLGLEAPIEFITKPIDFDELKGVLHSFTENPPGRSLNATTSF